MFFFFLNAYLYRLINCHICAIGKFQIHYIFVLKGKNVADLSSGIFVFSDHTVNLKEKKTTCQFPDIWQTHAYA